MDERRGAPVTDPDSASEGEPADDPPVRDRLRDALQARLGIDVRALAAFRIALAVVLLVDLALRARNLTAFYTDAGVLPRSLLAEASPVAARFSLHALSGAAWAVGLLFLVAAVAAVALAVGYRTRLATAASLVLLVSLHARNPFVLNAGDTLLWQLLGAGLLCPLGARWSVDARRDRSRSAGSESQSAGSGSQFEADRFVGPASALLATVAIVVYVSNAVVKLRGTAWPSGEAVGRVFRLTYLYGPFGDLVPEAPMLLAAATYGWLALVIASPLLVASVGRIRAALAATLFVAHLSMALTLQIGVFPLVSMTALIPFFPPFVWDRAERQVASTGDRLRQWVTRLSVPVTSVSLGSIPAASVPTPSVSGSSPHEIWRDRRTRGRVVAVVAALLLVTLLAWNGMALGLVGTPDSVATVADPADGGWEMFAPRPPSAETRVLATATIADGDRIDALYGDRVATDRPPSDARAYPTARWRKYLVLLSDDEDPARTDALLTRLCDRAAGFTDEEVRSVAVSFAEIDVEGTDETRVRELGTRDCR